jgi:selenocysteine-specific translation elongation factor
MIGRGERRDLAELLPSGHPVTIRNIQVHGKTVRRLCGQRTALNLAGVKKSEIERVTSSQARHGQDL